MDGEGDTGGEGEGDTGGESVGGIVEDEGVAEVLQMVPLYRIV